jgi:hypothetical protein
LKDEVEKKKSDRKKEEKKKIETEIKSVNKNMSLIKDSLNRGDSFQSETPFELGDAFNQMYKVNIIKLEILKIKYQNY